MAKVEVNVSEAVKGWHESKNAGVLADFILYCYRHPDERFWQALLNWSEANFILRCGGSITAYDHVAVHKHDTYYREGK